MSAKSPMASGNFNAAENKVPDLTAVGDAMRTVIRATDWSKTPLGAIEGWSPSLRMMVNLLLANRFPLLLWWGPDYISIYNDAYRPVLGSKHPWALGKPVRDCWSEIWHVLQPLIDAPFNGGPATWMEDLQLELNRHGFVEEAHFTVAYSPVPDDTAPNGIGGVLATVHEITDKIVGERRITALRDLGARAGDAKTTEEACAIAADALSSHSRDVPFALFYLIDSDRKRAMLAAAAGVATDEVAASAVVDLDPDLGEEFGWPLAEAFRSEATVIVENLANRFREIPVGPWSDPPCTAVIIPIKSNVSHRLAGFLVAGASPRLRLDEQYRSFFDLMAAQIATAIANARAYEEERKRAEALAEIDRAKTQFFSNVSHEFRTPLTLILGPLQNAIANTELPASEREQLDVAHRNSVRLLKLVNSLLDFSRIEAGRAEVIYEPVDFAELSAELASNFRSACERAGLKLTICCPPLPQPVYVDRDMWEKIVLNLLSNAFKFTFAGEIEVAVRPSANGVAAELTVRDTGVGIPESELPRLFDRFHRIEGQKSRTYEGSGIGLALVQELVRLHGGTIHAGSTAGAGTTFTIAIPFGIQHLAQDRISAERTFASNSVRAAAYVEEALRWLPDASTTTPGEIDGSGLAPPVKLAARILVADDNADMRAYIRRLLGRDCEVQTVSDGEAALKAIREQRPDLVLADVMMPHLDGFGLLREIRSDPAIRDLPVVMLSARAGEEARIEGLKAGTDDYLAKPFSARELLARIKSNLQISGIRKEAEQTLRRNQNWLKGQKEAFQAAMDGAPLKTSLDILIRTAIEPTDSERQCAFYIANADRSELQYVTGMSESYARCVDGFKISAESLACGLAVSRGEPIITRDVYEEPRWAPWLWLAREYDYRGCWSFPVETSSGMIVGSFAMYFREPREPTSSDLELAKALADTAGIIISRYQETQARANAEERVRNSEQQLRLATDAANIGLWDVDVVNNRLFWPPRVKEMFGISADVPVSMADFYAGLHPEDRERVSAAFAAALDPKIRALYDVEYRTVGKEDGAVRWVAAKGRGLFDGEICVRVIGTAIDITAGKRTTEDLERFNRLAVGREMRMIELKKEINTLRWRLGEQARYPLKFEEEAARQ